VTSGGQLPPFLKLLLSSKEDIPPPPSVFTLFRIFQAVLPLGAEGAPPFLVVAPPNGRSFRPLGIWSPAVIPVKRLENFWIATRSSPNASDPPTPFFTMSPDRTLPFSEICVRQLVCSHAARPHVLRRTSPPHFFSRPLVQCRGSSFREVLKSVVLDKERDIDRQNCSSPPLHRYCAFLCFRAPIPSD